MCDSWMVVPESLPPDPVRSQSVVRMPSQTARGSHAVTIVDTDPTSQRAPWAKQRILDTASELFYREGIRQVGVDRLISLSGVTKATFYKHYRAKENLVVAYAKNRHERDVAKIESIIEISKSPKEAIAAIVEDLIGQFGEFGFRGDAYLNAAVEYPDTRHPIRVVISTHRDWYSGVIESLLTKLGHPLPGEGADDFVALQDGAMMGAYAGDSVAAAGALRRGVDRIVAGR